MKRKKRTRGEIYLEPLLYRYTRVVIALTFFINVSIDVSAHAQ